MEKMQKEDNEEAVLSEDSQEIVLAKIETEEEIIESRFYNCKS